MTHQYSFLLILCVLFIKLGHGSLSALRGLNIVRGKIIIFVNWDRVDLLHWPSSLVLLLALVVDEVLTIH